MTIFGNGTQSRGFSYIDDVALYIARSVHVPAVINQTINIGASEPYTVRQLAEIVAVSFRVEPRIQFLPARNEVLHAFADHSKAHGFFNITNTTDLRNGVARMAKWVKQVGTRKSHSFGEIEVEKNLPPSWRDVI